MSSTASPLTQSWLVLPDGQTFWLNARCSVGRHPGNDLVLASNSVSRQHAMLTANGSGVYSVNDLRSSNGTFVNTSSVVRSVTLRDNDELRFGDVILRFRCSRPEGEAPDAGMPTGEITRRIEKVSQRTCWVLVADVIGSARLNAELGSEAALRHLQAWITGMRPLIEDHAGQINSYVGDGLLAWWAAETPRERVLAALTAIEAWRASSPVRFRIVLHHGSVLCTRSERGEELTGQDVNFAFRAEKIAKGFGTETLLSEPAMNTLYLAGRCPPLGVAPVEGIPGRFVFFGAPKIGP